MTTTTKKTTRTRTKPVVETTAKETKLPPNPFMNEILDFVVEQETDEDKVKILKEYENDALKALFIWNFDSTVISVLPQGEVPFRPNESPLGTDHSSLRREFKHLYNFVKGGNDAMNRLRKETMFINLLESFHPGEAEVLCLVKDKKLQTKYNITKELVSEAYPDIQWGNRS